MEIHFNDVEEEAIKNYAKINNITYGEALQKIINAMQKGLNEINKDPNIAALDSGVIDSDNP
jgi:hypothetical protein